MNPPLSPHSPRHRPTSPFRHIRLPHKSLLETLFSPLAPPHSPRCAAAHTTACRALHRDTRWSRHARRCRRLAAVICHRPRRHRIAASHAAATALQPQLAAQVPPLACRLLASRGQGPPRPPQTRRPPLPPPPFHHTAEVSEDPSSYLPFRACHCRLSRRRLSRLPIGDQAAAAAWGGRVDRASAIFLDAGLGPPPAFPRAIDLGAHMLAPPPLLG